jgi:two-component sensor histidine kinase
VDLRTQNFKALEYQRALGSFSRIAGGSVSADRLMHYTASQVSLVTHIQHVKIMRYRPDQGDLLIVAGVGWKPGVVGRETLGVDKFSPGGRAIQTGAPVVIEDLANDPEYRYSDLLRDHDIVSVINVPIMIDGKTWGVLEVDSVTPRCFDDLDTSSLTIFANLLGLVLDRQEIRNRFTEAVADNSRTQSRAEVLLLELQHRVKNNFQIILSFLALQRRQATTDEARERINSAMDRVFAIALAHDQLSMKEGGSSVDFGDYLRALCANIDPARPGITLEVVAEATPIPLDRAVAAGLLVNELVTNAIKHAFPDGEGSIRVKFATSSDTAEGCITVEDDGRGMNKSVTAGLGSSLIQGLTAQLGGRLERPEASRGVQTTICFPVAL